MNLHIGHKGHKVKLLQLALGANSDGFFGKNTELAVKEFQRSNGLVIDGIVGINTSKGIFKGKVADSFRDATYTVSKLIPKGKIHNKGDISIDPLLKLFSNRDSIRFNLRLGLIFVNRNKEVFKLDTPTRLAHFMAQVREEVGYNFTVTENLNYSFSGLIRTFKFYSKNHDKARKDSYNKSLGKRANQVNIANNAYANRLGNGNSASGDGWRYRGRGGFQTTGKYNYQELDDFMDKSSLDSGEIPNFTIAPEMVNDGLYSLVSAAVFWVNHKMYLKADGGINKKSSYSVTKIINKHTSSYNKRWGHTKKAAELMELGKDYE